MASAPPSDASQDRNQALTALALLLAGTRTRYNLPALVRQSGRKPRPFRQIRPTNALKADLAAPYFDITKGWQAEIDALVSAYDLGGSQAVAAQLGTSTANVEQIVSLAKRRFPAIVQRIEQWHRNQFQSRIKAASGLDVGMLMSSQDVDDDTQGSVAWNQSLADDVHQQARHGIATAFLAGAAASLPVDQVRARVDQVIAKARRRSAAIGDDQVDKLSRAMDRSRAAAASLTTYRWHHTPQRHPRNWHLARDGQTFGANDIPADDRAGIQPFCKCWEEYLLQ